MSVAYWELRPKSLPGVRPVAYIVGVVLVAAGVLMLVPLWIDAVAGNREWTAFAVGSAVSGLLGAVLMATSWGGLRAGLTLRQAFVLTPLSWLSVAVMSAIPFYLCDLGPVHHRAADAFFESVSGITTTGATVLTGLDTAPPGILMWRALLQWMGGIGIIATAIAILPALGIGGMQLFRTESSDRSPKAMPRVRQIAAAIGISYLALTGVAATVYWTLGMTLFDAIAHAFTSIATGGFSTSDRSFAAWEANGIQWFASAFMLAGTLPFVLYVRLVSGQHKALWDRQVRTLLVFLAAIIAFVGSWLYFTGMFTLEAAFRHAAFNVISIVTTTGFASTDYMLWGNALVGLFFCLTFVGGCTGSTSGGIKIFRFEVLAITLKVHFLRLIYPRGVFPKSYDGRPIDDEVINSVVAFFVVFFLCYVLLSLALLTLGLDVTTSSSGAATALANVGPGLGPVIGPSGNFSSLPETAKWLLSAGMLLGRLELFTVLVLLVPKFWR
jgi:trk system potassium uptake protein TrkH